MSLPEVGGESFSEAPYHCLARLSAWLCGFKATADGLAGLEEGLLIFIAEHQLDQVIGL